MRLALLLAVALCITVRTVGAAGLGATFSEFEQEWGQGYRQEFTISAAFKDIYVGKNKKRSVAYSKGSHDFSGRVGFIRGETWGLFVPDNQTPTVKQFLTGIKKMMPADAKLIAKYRTKRDYIKDIYVFKSESLAKLPGVATSSGYYGEPKEVGKFILIVNYNIDNSDYVANFTMALGNGESDTYVMKKVKASW